MPKVGSMVIEDAKLQEALHADAEGGSYTGAGDNLVDFGGAKSFVDEDKTGKRVNIKIKNVSEEDKTIRLNDILENPAGSILLTDGTNDGLTVKSSPRNYAVVRSYLESHPTRIRSIKFNADEAVQLDEPLKYVKETPWMTSTTEERIPSTFQSQDTNNPKMSEVNDIADWMLCDTSTILYTIQAGREVTLTFTFGGSFDAAYALGKKAHDAEMTVARAYIRANQ